MLCHVGHTLRTEQTLVNARKQYTVTPNRHANAKTLTRSCSANTLCRQLITILAASSTSAVRFRVHHAAVDSPNASERPDKQPSHTWPPQIRPRAYIPIHINTFISVAPCTLECEEHLERQTGTLTVLYSHPNTAYANCTYRTRVHVLSLRCGTKDRAGFFTLSYCCFR